MPRFTIAACVLITCAALPAGAFAQEQQGHGIELSYRDTTCAPCRDFFRYANGTWDDRTPIPAAYSRYGVDREIEDRSTEALRKLLEQAAADVTAPRGGNRWKLGAFYSSCMDSERAEREGAKPLAPAFAEIEAIRTPAALATTIAHLHAEGVPLAFGFRSQQDFKNSDQVIAVAAQGGLGLPDRDYYLKTDSTSVALRDAYVGHITRTFELLGTPHATAAADAQRILALETALAKSSMTRVQRRDPNAVYHKMALAELRTLSPRFDWNAYLAAQGLHVTALNVAQPEFFKGLNRELTDVPLADWKVYLRWHVVRDAAPILSSAFVDEDFHFTQKLTGQRAMLPRWRRCLQATDNELGEALGQEFVKLYFTPENKARTLDMVHNLEAALKARLGTLAWMSDSTKQAAIRKLAAFDNKIGYPDHWRDYSALTLDRNSPYYANVIRAEAFEWRRELHKIGRPVDRTEWGMTPPTVNAYYNPTVNEIVFPAGILQPPYYDPLADDAYNYGSMGGTIGHEMTHGFDDSGRQFDARGNLKDWWTPSDAEHYKAQAQRVVDEYNGFVAVDTFHVNGRLTLGENIADLGGLVVAWDAWQRARVGKPPQPVIDGYTPEQRFFLGYAQSWREKTRPERARVLAVTDPHSPEKWRVNGVVMNMPEFARAFGCKQGDPMVLPDEQRAVIW
ncbi:MAG TPA: M13 family metallopeptidase [Candidatus Eisenbacteria bacterium]|nr:M13 family metallopeptidase [Candidatus Eisenbacteria bacterium]